MEINSQFVVNNKQHSKFKSRKQMCKCNLTLAQIELHTLLPFWDVNIKEVV